MRNVDSYRSLPFQNGYDIVLTGAYPGLTLNNISIKYDSVYFDISKDVHIFVHNCELCNKQNTVNNFKEEKERDIDILK